MKKFLSLVLAVALVAIAFAPAPAAAGVSTGEAIAIGLGSLLFGAVLGHASAGGYAYPAYPSYPYGGPYGPPPATVILPPPAVVAAPVVWPSTCWAHMGTVYDSLYHPEIGRMVADGLIACPAGGGHSALYYPDGQPVVGPDGRQVIQ